MNTSITVRPTTADDYEVLCGLSEAVAELHREALATIFRKLAAPPRDLAFVNAAVAGPNSTIFVAEIEGRTIGTTRLLLRHQQPTPIRRERKYIEIDNMAVEPAFRRRGVGRALVDAAIAWASGRGVDTIELNVCEFNRSGAAFYRSMGFETNFRRLKCRVRR
jgi:diamine N-acetyltransferase